MKKLLLTTIITTIFTFIGSLFLFEYLDNRNQDGAIYASIKSEFMNEKREFIITLPESYQYNKSKEYPVMFVLDGSSQDHHIAYKGAILASINAAEEFITVGIPNTRGNRSRDLTPSNMKIDLENPKSKTGNGDRFLSFIEKELIPYIDKNYRATSHRMFSGNSRGGLLVMHAFLKKSTLFDAYFCYSPAFWRENQKIVSETAAFLNKKDSLNTFLYISLGKDENEKMKRGFTAMESVLKKHKVKGLNWKSALTPHANHSTNAYLSSPMAIKQWGSHFKNINE